MIVTRAVRSVSLSLDFTDEEERPVFRPMLGTKKAVFDALRVEFLHPSDSLGESYLSGGSGWYLNLDGTRSKRRADCSGTKLSTVPEPFYSQIVTAAGMKGALPW